MRRKPAYYVVVDVEATCCNDNSFPRNEMEIIELGAVIVEAVNLDIIDEFQAFVRPNRHPKLTRFCLNLTTIRQVDVEFAPTFARVLRDFTVWLRPYSHHLFCSWGKYDRHQIERDCRYHRVPYPFDKSHLDLKQAFAKRQSLSRPIGMASALRKKGLHLQGTHHRGIDDAINIARLLPFIV